MTNTISCPVCNNVCSVEATSCPKCGHPFQKAVSLEQNGVNKPKNIWKILTIGLGLAVLVSLFGYVFYTRFLNQPKTYSANTINSTTANAKPIETPLPKAILNLEAAVIYKMDGVKPIAREKFYLLDQSAETILKSAGLKPSKLTPTVLSTFCFSILFDGYGDTKKWLSAINEHIKYTVTTDFNGKAKFENVKPDTYFLFGITKTRGGCATWNMQKIIIQGDNSQTLDNNNASEAF